MAIRFLLLIAFATFAAAAPAAPVPEPQGYWQGPMRGETPASVEGAHVIDTSALEELLNSAHPLLLDVAEADKKPPAAASKDVPWMPAHRSIPGAVWLPGAGSGRTDPAFESAFKGRISAHTGGNLDHPIVVFCHPRCWGSWNAAKRLSRLGYRRIYWYPEGAEGWESRRDLQTVKEDAAWTPPASP